MPDSLRAIGSLGFPIMIIGEGDQGDCFAAGVLASRESQRGWSVDYLTGVPGPQMTLQQTQMIHHGRGQNCEQHLKAAAHAKTTPREAARAAKSPTTSLARGGPKTKT
jgi:hypothetical protein